MSRYDETTGVAPNPSQFFLEWNSELNAFSYWEKDSKTRIAYPLPLRFAALKFMNTVTGFDEVRRQGLYSNEVADTRTEELRVMYRDGTPCSKGLYSQIKERVNSVGGRYTRSIYACSPKGVIINIKLTGAQMINFGLIEKFGKRWQDEWIEVRTFESKMRDDKPYSAPIFGFGGSFSTHEIKITGESYAIVKNYFDSKAYSPPAAQVPVNSPAVANSAPNSWPETIEDDDLPF